MDLKQLEYIVAIAEEKNITKAAEKIYITQSALNQQLLKVEKELGTPIFKRGHRRFELTESGKIYIEACQNILRLKQDAYRQINDITEQSKGVLSIGFTTDRGFLMFSSIFPVFNKLFPNITVKPFELSVIKQQKLLQSGELDIGLITIAEKYYLNQLSYQVLNTEKILLACPSSIKITPIAYSMATDFPIADISELEDDPFVLINKNSTLRTLIDDIFADANFIPKVLFETTSNQTVLEMIKAGLCCGVIPSYYAVESESVNYFELPACLEWEICAVYNKNHYLSEASKAFINLAEEYFLMNN